VICPHCKDRLRVVTIDESLSSMITVQATEIHRLERLLSDNKIEYFIDKKGIYIDEQV